MAALAKLFTVTAVGALAFIVGRHSSKAPRVGRKDTFVLAVTIEFESRDKLDEFIGWFKPLAAYVRDNEPDTLSYELSISDVKPNQILIFERYANKEEAYLKTHKSSATFLEFREKVVASGVPLSGVSYFETGVGFP